MIRKSAAMGWDDYAQCDEAPSLPDSPSVIHSMRLHECKGFYY